MGAATVTAFTGSAAKTQEAISFGATNVIDYTVLSTAGFGY